MEPFPAEYELVGLFESQPTLTDADVPWFYNRLRFAITRGTNEVVCEIEPASEIVQVSWKQNGAEIVRLDMNWVRALVVENANGYETLVGYFRDASIEPFRLQMRPTVSVRWGTPVEPRPNPTVLSNTR